MKYSELITATARQLQVSKIMAWQLVDVYIDVIKYYIKHGGWPTYRGSVKVLGFQVGDLFGISHAVHRTRSYTNINTGIRERRSSKQGVRIYHRRYDARETATQIGTTGDYLGHYTSKCMITFNLDQSLATEAWQAIPKIIYNIVATGEPVTIKLFGRLEKFQCKSRHWKYYHFPVIISGYAWPDTWTIKLKPSRSILTTHYA